MNAGVMKTLSLAIFFVIALMVWTVISANDTPDPDEAEGRLKMALQIARENNDRKLVATVEELGRAFGRTLPADGEAKLRELERKVGIDPGGWSMAGQPLFHPTPEMLKQSKELEPKLAAAIKSEDATKVRMVTAEMLAVLGDQAGVPDGRRAGVKPNPLVMNEADATKLFLDALAAEGRTVRQLTEGHLLPDQMVRIYAYLLSATNTIHPCDGIASS